MYLQNTESNLRPPVVVLNELEDGTKSVRLADNIREVETEDGATMYVYDEAVFTLEADRTETADDILEDFATWWEYGIQPEEPLPTLEERVEMIEELLMGGM